MYPAWVPPSKTIRRLRRLFDAFTQTRAEDETPLPPGPPSTLFSVPLTNMQIGVPGTARSVSRKPFAIRFADGLLDILQMADRGENVPNRGVRGSIGGSLALVAWDVAAGSFVTSLFACPIWFLVSVTKSAIQRPGSKIALVRAAIPLVTLAVVLANSAVQSRIAKANAEKVVSACEQFRADNGRFPHTLDALVPEYLGFVPRAKYCLMWDNFLYFNNGEHPILVWVDVPPFGRPTYDFQNRRWGYVD